MRLHVEESYIARIRWLRKLLKKIPRVVLVGAEIGVWKGDFIVHLLKAELRVQMIYAIDPYLPLNLEKTEEKLKIWDKNFERIRRKLSVFGRKVVMVRGRSEEVSDFFLPGTLDFISIDGEHTYEQVTKELTLYEPKVAEGGLFCGHDYYGRASTGVKQAVDEYAAAHGREVNSIEENIVSWWWFKQ